MRCKKVGWVILLSKTKWHDVYFKLINKNRLKSSYNKNSRPEISCNQKLGSVSDRQKLPDLSRGRKSYSCPLLLMAGVHNSHGDMPVSINLNETQELQLNAQRTSTMIHT